MKQHAHLLALSGISSPILLLIGIAMAVFKLNRSTSTVDLSDPVKVKKVIASIELFNQQIGQAFSSFILAFVLAIALLLPFLIAVIKLGYRRPWAFYFCLIYGIVLLSLIPIGIPFGLFLIIFAITNHKAFFTQQHPVPSDLTTPDQSPP